MSYVRFGEADVYVYADVGGFLCCCGCSLDDQYEYHSTESMIAHLREHQKQGDFVPDFVFDDLQTDAEENDRWIEESQRGKPVRRAPSSRFKRDVDQAISDPELGDAAREALGLLKSAMDEPPRYVDEGLQHPVGDTQTVRVRLHPTGPVPPRIAYDPDSE